MYSENTLCCGLKVIHFPGIAKLYLQPSSRHKVFNLSLQSVNLSSKKSLQTIKQKQKNSFLLFTLTLLQNAYITSHCYFLSNLVFVSWPCSQDLSFSFTSGLSRTQKTKRRTPGTRFFINCVINDVVSELKKLGARLNFVLM